MYIQKGVIMLDGWTAQSDKKHYSIYSQLRYEVGGTNCCHLLCSKVKGQWVSEWVSSLSTSATLATAMGTTVGNRGHWKDMRRMCSLR